MGVAGGRGYSGRSGVHGSGLSQVPEEDAAVLRPREDKRCLERSETPTHRGRLTHQQTRERERERERNLKIFFRILSNSQLRLGRFLHAPYTDGPSPFWNWPHPFLLGRRVDCQYEVWVGVAVFHRGQSTAMELFWRLYLYPRGAEWNLRLIGLSLRLVILCRVLFQQH